MIVALLKKVAGLLVAPISLLDETDDNANPPPDISPSKKDEQSWPNNDQTEPDINHPPFTGHSQPLGETHE